MLGMKRYAPALTFTKRGSAAVRTRKGPLRNRHVARRLIARASSPRIGSFCLEARETRVDAPGLLHEFELAFDARVDAEEMDAALLPVVGKVEEGSSGRPGSLDRSAEPGRKRRSERPRSTQQTMGLGHAERLSRGVRLDDVAGIRAADVRTERARQTIRVVAVHEVVAVDGLRDRRRLAPEPAAPRWAIVRRIETPARSYDRVVRARARTVSMCHELPEPRDVLFEFAVTT